MMRVQLHPACDDWMRGDRFGDLLKVVKRKGKATYHVKLDVSGKVRRVPEELIYELYN